MRGTQKPCSGCGETKKRNVKEVCNNCKTLIQDGKRYRDEIEKLKNQSDMIKVQIPTSYSTNFPIYYPKTGKVKEGIGTLLVDLANLLLKNPTDDINKIELGLFRKSVYYDRFDHMNTGYMVKQVALRLHALHFTIQSALDHVEENAIKYGRNLLKQLATGKISTNDFDSFGNKEG